MSGYAINTLGGSPKRHTNLVVGPDGFTESFNDNTVDVLVRMGLVRANGTTSAADWETRFYTATGRAAMKIGGE